MVLRLGAGLLALGLLFGGANAVSAEPGTADGVEPLGQAQALPEFDRPFAASGLKVFYNKFGRYSLSVDAAGGNTGRHTIKVRKPSGRAKVEKAFLMASSLGQRLIKNGDIRLQRKAITWTSSVLNDLPPFTGFFHNVMADVTGIVKNRVDSSTNRTVSFRIDEVSDTFTIDGEILVVVFNDPAQTRRRTVALLFGALQTGGDRFEVQLSKPIDKTTSGARARMGLGISYSYQENATQQYSTIDVNGNRLSTAAGGEDDGTPENGGLITVGGIGDSAGNPSNPNAFPTNARSDDEAYNLLPYVSDSDRIIRVDTRNPSNDDNILFAWFDLSVKGAVNKDTDGDGLLDAWEKNGYDHDGDGIIDVPIHQLGADWRHKDIFIAYAWMAKGASDPALSHEPRADSLEAMRKAFARAPVKNPDGKRGIRVHYKNLGSVPHDDDLNPVWTEFDAIMDPLVSEAERHIYRRMLSGHGYNGGGSSGIARDIPASDFVMTLGRFSSNPGTFAQQAGTIMHELGHTLGLRHGGVDNENYKPNHLSVMSYLNQLDWLIRRGQPFLDYERFELKNLNENRLNERRGLDRIGGDRPLRKYGVRWVAGGFLRSKSKRADVNVNWNVQNGSRQRGVQQDINNTGTRSVLRAEFNEWANIIYDGGTIGAGAGPELPLMTKPSDLDELSEAEYLRMIGSARK